MLRRSIFVQSLFTVTFDQNVNNC